MSTELQERYVSWLHLNGELAPGALDSWQFFEHREGDEQAAIAMVKGTEIHFAVNPAWRRRLITRRSARAFLKPLMDRFGFLTTRSLMDDEEGAVFLLRLGFVKTWTSVGIHCWMLTELPFTRPKET